MKLVLYYFTGTGNSLAVAKEIAKEQGNCELISIPNAFAKKRIETDAQMIGIVTPLYYSAVPNIVTKFLKQFTFPSNAYLFAIITRAMPPVGGAISYINSILKSRKLDSGFYVTMPNSDINSFLDITNPQTQKKRISASKERVKEIVLSIQSQQKKFDKEPLNFLRPMRYSSYQKRIRENIGQYYWTNKNCTLCRSCIDLCPLNNISEQNSGIIWNGNCIECQRCIHLCPSQAIQFKKSSVKRGRYKHPDITLEDLRDDHNRSTCEQ